MALLSMTLTSYAADIKLLQLVVDLRQSKIRNDPKIKPQALNVLFFLFFFCTQTFGKLVHEENISKNLTQRRTNPKVTRWMGSFLMHIKASDEGHLYQKDMNY